MRALAAAITLVFMTSGSTAMSSLFVIYINQWGLSSADIAVVFSVYVGTLLPVLLLFGGLAERFGRRPVTIAGILAMVLGLVLLSLAHSLPWLIVARLFQGVGVGLSVGAVTAALAESYRGKLPSGTMLQSVAAFGLFTGPVISAIAFNLGGGLNLSYVPALVMVIGVLALTPLLAERATTPAAAAAVEDVYSADVVARALRLALPLAFVSWAALSLFLSLVPAYLAAALHALNPAIGAGAILATQIASLVATLRLGNAAPERSGILGAIVSIGGLAILIVGTSANIWLLVGLATVLVGAGGGVASAAAFGIAGRIGRGQRTRVFARMYVAAYAGYSLPTLAIGLIAVHASFAVAFIAVVAVLAVMTATLPLLRERIPACARELAPAA
ncbi:MAG TPA: MFS transporter [Candidatus Aquilonibacter sp.]